MSSQSDPPSNNCAWYATGNGNEKRCSRAGCPNRMLTDHPPERCYGECLSPDCPAGPPLWRRAINFAGAVFHQAPLTAEAILTGDESKAYRSQEEIEAIASICKSCPLFNGEICTHPSCGCGINPNGDAFFSKLAWKSQNCPDKRW